MRYRLPFHRLRDDDLGPVLDLFFADHVYRLTRHPHGFDLAARRRHRCRVGKRRKPERHRDRLRTIATKGDGGTLLFERAFVDDDQIGARRQSRNRESAVIVCEG
jgi:hypothetical protein